MLDKSNLKDFISDIYLLADILAENSDEESIEIISNYYMKFDKKHIILMWFMTILLLDDLTVDSQKDRMY